ncbi:MAG: GH3 auxin-responsive promoter family protein [Gemmataceae bacterium]|nr:GH3 auxin-responsive promoter family protein [Gemmataceae bacterium]
MLKALINQIVQFYPIRKALTYPIRRQIRRFDAATQRPREVQAALLQRILRRQADTAFGRDHGFAQVRTLADFRRHVPVAGYERLEPYIDRVRRGEFRALLADPEVLMFALTSGTTAARKFIPVTRQYVDDYKRGWQMWGVRVYADHPEVRLKPILQLAGDPDEFRTEAGIPCGAITGLTAQMQKRIIRWLYCVPGPTGRIKNIASKYYVALRLSIPRKVGMIIAANPSTLLHLARAGDQQKERLIRDIHDGRLSGHVDLPADIRATISRGLRPNPRRARELEEVVRRTGHLYPSGYWPHKFLIGTWTGGSVGAYVRHLPDYFGPQAVIRDVGLIASEGRMTIPFADGTPSGTLDITSHFFEFIPEEEIDSPCPTVLEAHELLEGRNYYILPTTAYGLYRYDIHDVVRVTGFHHQTPQIEFLSKGAHFANLTGEKLSEYQVVQAVRDATRELDLCVGTYSLAPCWNEELPYYGLFVERGELPDGSAALRLAEAVERRLMELNSEYAAKRESQRLDAVRVELLPPGAWQRWDGERLARSGGTQEQYKHPCLINDLRFRDSMPVEREIAPLYAH